jgi:hypothetical protein
MARMDRVRMNHAARVASEDRIRRTPSTMGMKAKNFGLILAMELLR